MTLLSVSLHFWRSTFLVTMAAGAVVGCTSDLQTDWALAPARSKAAWTISGERRFTLFMGLAAEFRRDTFRSVLSDGKRFVVAHGAQNNESWPEQQYLYIIDGLRGRVVAVRTIPHSVWEFAMSDQYVVLCAHENLRDEDRVRVHAFRLSDGTKSLDIAMPSLGLKSIHRLKVEGTTAQIDGFETADWGTSPWRNVKIDLVSGEVASSRTLPNEAREDDSSALERRSTARCGDLFIQALPEVYPCWLIASREVGRD